MDFIYLFRVLLKKKWIIIGSAIVAATIAYILTRNEPKNYRSTAQMSTGFTTMDEDINLNENSRLMVETETRFSNVLHTFTSPSVISLLSYNLILHDLGNPQPYTVLKDDKKNSDIYKEIDANEARKIFQSKLESMTPLTSYKPEEKKLLEYLALYGYDYKSIMKRLNIYRLARTDYIQIDFLSNNPELSAFVVNNVYQQFMRYYKNVRGDFSQESIDTLKSIMDKRQQALVEKSAAMKDRGLIDIDIVGTSAYELIAQMKKDLSDIRSKKTQNEVDLQKVDQRLRALENKPTNNNNNNSELVMARSAMNDAYNNWIKSGKSDQSLYDKYKKLQEEYNDKARNIGGDDENEDKSAKSRTELLNERSDLLLDIQANNRDIAALNSQINQMEGKATSIASEGQTAEGLRKEWELANKEYLDAKQKYNLATESNGSPINKFRQVVFGQPAIEPEPSKRLIIVAMGGTAAMVTTILIIILLTYLDSSIKTPIIFSRSVNLKLISMINFMDLKNKNLADIVANKDGTENIHDRNKFNAFRESIRKLRYEIESSKKKIFLFTSTKKGQGKTTLIQALSYSMSLSKKKILIIDTNFCNNDLTVQLQAEPVLEKIVPFKSDVVGLLEQVRVISKDIGVGTVYAIGSEGGDYTPSEILPRENLLQHLPQLTAEFDYIFLEGPPLNDFSDSKELAEYVEGVIAVFSAKQIIKQIDKQSITFFKELNGKFCGSILNMVDLENVNVA